MSAPSGDAPGQMPFGPYINEHMHPRRGGGEVLWVGASGIPNNIMMTAKRKERKRKEKIKLKKKKIKLKNFFFVN